MHCATLPQIAQPIEDKILNTSVPRDLFSSPFHRRMQSTNIVASPHFQMLFYTIYVCSFRLHSCDCILQCKIIQGIVK